MKWFTPSSNIGDKPWIHPEAVKYLESIISPDMEVVEFGGGGSTVWFSSRVSRVVTYENNYQWREIIKGKDLPNVDIRENTIWNGFDRCDLLFIDGEPVAKRAAWLMFAHDISCDWIILDNANRPEYEDERNALKEYAELVHTVNGNVTGTRYLVTEFWRVK